MEYKLRSCVWEITLACCFSCAYCGSKAGRARVGELTTEECMDVADQLAGLGCRRVSLIGGEVFMRPDWHAIVAFPSLPTDTSFPGICSRSSARQTWSLWLSL